MPAQTKRDLFLQVSGNVDPLTAAMKAGKSVLAEFGAAANDTTAEVNKAFQQLGGADVQASAKALEDNYKRAFANIRTNAASVLAAPSGEAAFDILSASAARDAVAAAESRAAGLRLVADAATTVANRTSDASSAQRAYATAAEANALAAEHTLVGLRGQAEALGMVEREMLATGAVSRQMAAATEAAAQAEADLQRKAEALRMSIDPAYAGQQRFNAAMVDARMLVSRGAISLDEYCAKLRQETMLLDQTGGAHGRMNIAGMEAEHVVRALSDSIAAGASPIRAVTMELGRITQAMTLYAQTSNQTEGMLGKFAGFMGGPWGMAISIGVALLAPLAVELLKSGNAAEEEGSKLRKNAQDTHVAELAKAAFAETQDGLIAKTRELTKELDKQNEALRSNAERQNVATRESLAALQAKRPAAVQELADAQAAQKKALGGGAYQLGASAAANLRVAAAQATLSALDKGISGASVAYQRSRIPLAAEQAKQDVDPVARINHLYDERIRLVRAAAEEAVKEGRVVGAATEKRLAAIEVERKAALKAEQDKKAAATRSERDDEQTGRKINFATASSIVQGIGGRVTSSPTRSLEEQQRLYGRYMAYKDGSGPWAPLAAKPGTSMHGTGQAIDVAKSAGMTLAKIVEAFRAQGVHLIERLDEGDHFHVAWGGKGKAGPSAETLAKRQQSADDKDTRNAEAYGQAMDRAQEEMLRLQRQQVTDKGAAAALDVQSIQIERARLDSAAQAGAAERKWSQAQADALIAQNGINAQLKIEAVNRAELSRQVQQMFVDSQDARDARDSLMQIDAEMADTRKERLDVERKLLADRQQSRYESLEKVAQDPNSSPEDFARAERGMAALPAQNAAENRQLDRQYQSPMDGYRDELKKNVGDMGDAMQGVELDGIKGVQDGLMGVLSGTKSVAQGFKDMAMSIIADLEKIAIEKLILSFIGLKDGGMVPAFADGGLPGFAGGGNPVVDRGIIRGAGTGRSDSIMALVGGRKPILVSNGEGIVNARAVRDHWPVIDAMNKGTFPAFANGGLIDPARIYMRALPSAAAVAKTPPTLIQQFNIDAKGGILANELMGQMSQLSQQHAQAAMIGGAAQAREDAADDARNTIR